MKTKALIASKSIHFYGVFVVWVLYENCTSHDCFHIIQNLFIPVYMIACLSRKKAQWEWKLAARKKSVVPIKCHLTSLLNLSDSLLVALFMDFSMKTKIKLLWNKKSMVFSPKWKKAHKTATMREKNEKMLSNSSTRHWLTLIEEGKV